MALCRIEGSSDLYGLGIRLGFYLLWLAVIFGPWMAPTEVKTSRFILHLFIAAAFLALIILTAGNVDSIEPVEAYIVLLLMFGDYLALVPIYLWRLLTVCDYYWDLTRWPIVPPSELEGHLTFYLLLGALVYQYWFWFARIPILSRYNCQQYGFLFGQNRLDSKESVAVNALLYFILGVACLYILMVKIRHMVGLPGPWERRGTRSISRRHKQAHIHLLRNIETWIRIIVATVVTIAIELTIQWNELGQANSLAGVSQTIPFVIGIGVVTRILYIYFFPQDEDSAGSAGDSYYDGPRRSGPSSGRRSSSYSERIIVDERPRRGNRPMRPEPVAMRPSSRV